ncbi:FkbM family methyltransferase [Dysgonomonas sp. Marseille-P4361]|uniref:FkbM family methyltransferase n=1 Tax=Dysgonomonas sp. Marseille-P4361 TaxID=2161820 RepID=UPI00135899D2|nr:FkbM family methyltransferase [Dysgonomonas sp. Marseille-P4361]
MNKNNFIQLEQLNLYATNFIKYIFLNKVDFDTSLYYKKEDEDAIVEFIDNRIKSCLNGYNTIPVTSPEVKEAIEWDINTRKAVKATKKGYCLSLDHTKYYLPYNNFAENVFLHDYGLKYLPQETINYIKDKDFLDIGAFIGDSALLFLKKYSPRQVYAYEPINSNIELLSKTLVNNTVNDIQIVKKGIGDKEDVIDIHFDPTELSNSSINSEVTNNLSETQRVQISTIDNECKNRKTGLIKMDIEGAEFSAISGGMETIKRDKPVLLISMYHTGKDFFEIPPLLKKIVPEYKFRFMNLRLSHPFFEKVLIAHI